MNKQQVIRFNTTMAMNPKFCSWFMVEVFTLPEKDKVPFIQFIMHFITQK